MFCQQCGTQIQDGMAFCTNCGARQETASAAPANSQYANYTQPQPGVNGQYTQPQPGMNGQYAQPNNQYYQPAYQQGYAQGNTNTVPEASPSGSPKRVSFGEAIKLYFVNYVNFTGRSTVSEYWYAFLFNFLVSLCTSWIPVVGTIISLGLLIPGLSIGIRRLHDTGKSWAYMLMGLIPLAGPIILIIQYCKASDADNKWGPAARN